MKFWLLVGTLAWTVASASADGIDPGLQKVLDATGLKYQATPSGGGTVTFQLDDDRTQQVYLSAQTTQVGGLAWRELWSNAGVIDGQAEDLVNLLTRSAGENLGAWLLEESDQGYLAYFSVRVPAGLAPADLRAALEYAAWTADALEADWFEEDVN